MPDKVVLDTNVYISAYFTEGGIPRHLVRLAQWGFFLCYCSTAILKEIHDNLGELRTRERDIDDFLSKVVVPCQVEIYTVSANSKIDIIKEDPMDNHVLELAQVAEADYIVSGDKHLKKLGKYEYTRILTPRQYLDRLL